jgi:hypothetical protein
VVNHQGRKYLWAVKASNRYRKACLKYLKVVKTYDPDPFGSPTSRGPGFRKSLFRWWQHLADRAKSAGIPSQAAFHKSWWDYMRIECHWDQPSREKAAHSLMSLVEHLRPEPPKPDFDQSSVTCRECGLIHRFRPGNSSCPAKSPFFNPVGDAAEFARSRRGSASSQRSVDLTRRIHGLLDDLSVDRRARDRTPSRGRQSPGGASPRGQKRGGGSSSRTRG